jgi:hypothetical protein
MIEIRISETQRVTPTVPGETPTPVVKEVQNHFLASEDKTVVAAFLRAVANSYDPVKVAEKVMR